MNGPIDIVLPWVDGNDPAWRAERDKWKRKLGDSVDESANSEIRYQSWDNLQYWFRAVEQNMPWVHKIFFITWGHVPEWLDTEHPKLRIVRHDEYIPEKYLPTFNVNPIEMNVHRINDLSENYLMFNDDFFPLQPIDEDYYFRDDKVCDEAVESPIMPVDIGQISGWSCRMKANDLLFINRHFSKREVQARNRDKWFNSEYGDLLARNEGLSYWNNFCGFHDPHMANAMKKSTLKKLWDTEPDTMDVASHNRFRADTDLNQYLIRYWQLCEGNFIPRRTLGKPYLVTMDNYKRVAEDIRARRYQMVSLNEDCTKNEFESIRLEINSVLEEILSERSSFEK